MVEQLTDIDMRTHGERLADRVTEVMGSWKFIIWQAVVIMFWATWNVAAPAWLRWDPYPFIFLNLGMSTQAAFTAPVILMSGNRADAQDRRTINADLVLDIKTMALLQAIARKIGIEDE